MESGRIRYFELCLVLLVALSTPFLNSVLLLVRGPSALGQISSFRWINGSLHEIIALALLGYVLARRGRRFRDLGLQWSARDCGVGLIVAVVSYISYLAAGIVLQSIHFALVGDIATGNSSQAFFGHPGLPAVPYSLLNPFFEELIVRAYLMAEILELTGSSALATAVSVLVQTSYHLYYGWFGAACLAFPFLVFALYFARYRRALPLTVC